jgi:CRP-like cAMP-binding protein
MDFSLLRKFPILGSFTDEELTDLFANATEQHIAPGSFLCREGERDGHLYFLVSGEVAISKTDPDGRSQELARLGGGTLLGELSWIMDTPCSTSMEVRQEAFVVRLDGDTLTRQLQTRSPGAFKLSVALLKLLASRLMRMNDQFLELQTKANGNGHKKGEIERLRERILHDWSF